MVPRHHPSNEALAAYTSSQLAAGAGMVVASHLEACPRCADHARSLSGDVVARDLPSSKDLQRCTGPITDAGVPEAGPEMGLRFPDSMRGFELGAWRWAGPGLRMATVKAAASLGERVYLLKGRAGASLPRHMHRGTEWVLVLKGTFFDGHACFSEGDVGERYQGSAHELRIDSGGECVCLIATERPMRLFGLARVLEPFLGL